MNPYNGIESYTVIDMVPAPGDVIGIHTMELKGLSYRPRSTRNAGYFMNPYNGIERDLGPPKPNPLSYKNPYNGIESWRLKAKLLNPLDPNPYNGIESINRC